MPNKDLGSKWNFLDRRKASMGQSREDSSFAPFVENKLRCLVREYIQNSMDLIPKSTPTGQLKSHFHMVSFIARTILN